MAIDVTTLTTTDGRDLSVLKAWFDANATSFFGSSEIDDNTLLLKSEGETVLSFGFTNDRYVVTAYINSSSTASFTLGANNEYVRRLAKTAHGIAVSFSGYASGSDRHYPYGLFISKTSENRIGVVMAKSQSLNITANGFYYESIGGSLRSAPTSIVAASSADDITTLTPCVCSGANGEYMPDCFFTSFSQYKELDCTFIADGKEYLYNGYIAMR